MTPSTPAGRTVIMKLAKAPSNGAELQSIIKPLSGNIQSIRPITKSKSAYLDGVYVVRVSSETELQNLIKACEASGDFIYVEAVNQESLLATPNDPLAAPGAGQSYLSVIKAYEAWDISQGSEKIVIGISDTGIDFNHDDIKNNLYRNPDEIFNGLDDDGNGYIDDIHGYDFADGDSVAQVGTNVHGNQVAGIAGASTNNGIGIAGVGYKSKISPLKMFTSSNTISIGAYESILYAADEGYDIVNLSWGSVNSYSQAAQDIISYAAVEKNVVLIAAAGNTNARLDYYPASYDHVLSVGWANLDDTKANNGTYSYHIDLMAPGTSILSTYKNNGYTAEVGSSFASPQVAGTAALVKAHYPKLNALQIMEVIRTTTDDIYSITSNQAYKGQLGTGRLNAFKALTKDTLRAVRAEQSKFTTSQGSLAFFGDTVGLAFTLQNYLYPMKSGTVKFSTDSPYVKFITSVQSFGFTDSLENKSYSFPLLTLTDNAPADQSIMIRLDFTSGGYRDFQYLELKTSPDYLILGGSSALLVGGNGDLGISKGLNYGFRKDNNTLTRSMGILVGNSKTYLKDNVVNNLSTLTLEPNFENAVPIKQSTYQLSDSYVESSFTSMDGSLRVEQSIYQQDTQVFLLRYRIINLSGDTLRSLQAGIFADWLIKNNTKNKAFYNKEGAFVYAYDSDSSVFAGMKIYGETTPIAQSMDLNSYNGNVPDIGETLTDSIKYTWLNKALYDSAGQAGIGNDVSQSIATLPFSIPKNESHEVVFMLGASTSLDKLKKAFQNGESYAGKVLQTPALLERFSSCSGASLTINPKKDSIYRFYSDALGQNLIETGDTLHTGVLTKDTSYYAQSADKSYLGPLRKIEIKMVANVADFSLSMDTLYLDNPSINRVAFTDKSFQATSWAWDFDNGVTATIASPTVNFTSAGNYNISLSVVNSLGCSDSRVKKLVVAKRPATPSINEVVVCLGTTATLTLDGTTFRLYKNSQDLHPFFQGSSYSVANVQTSSTLYITQLENGFESLKKQIFVRPDAIKATYQFTQNLTSEVPSISIYPKGSYASVRWYIDGALAGTSDTLLLEVKKASYTLAFKVISAIGCTDSLSTTLNFKTSLKPKVSVVQVCPDEPFTLSPQNGNLFGFYRDEELMDLVLKGRHLDLPPLQRDTILYVTGLDEILPSEAVPVTITVVHFNDKIQVSTTPLYLEEAKTVSFWGNDDTSVLRDWYMDGVRVSRLDSISLFFNQEGDYQFKMYSENDIGCQSVDSLTLQVFATRPLGITPEDPILIYPNPSSGRFWLYLKGESSSGEVINLAGDRVVNLGVLGEENELDLSHLKSGIYFLRIWTNQKQSVHRLIITH